MPSRFRAALVALAALAALTSCGDDDDPAAEQTTSTTAADDTDTGADTAGETDTDDEPADDETDAPVGEAGDDDEYVAAAVEAITSQAEYDEDEARCVATALLEAAGGADALSEAGLSADTWTNSPETFAELGLPSDEETVEGLADALGGCGDGHELFLRSGGPEVDQAVRTCFTDGVDEEEVRLQLALSSVRGPDAVAARDTSIFDLLSACQRDSVAG